VDRSDPDTLAQLYVPAAGGELVRLDNVADITPALSPLYPQLLERMAASGVRMTGAPIAYYRPAPRGPGDESITVHAAFPFAGEMPADPGFDVVDLPAVEHAATLLHHGPMSEAFRTGQLIATWIDDNGYRPVGHGYAREVYLDCPPGDQATWVTEMQIEVQRAD